MATVCPAIIVAHLVLMRVFELGHLVLIRIFELDHLVLMRVFELVKTVPVNNTVCICIPAVSVQIR